MAKREYSDYQKKIIRGFYDNRRAIALQSLGEIVSEIYMTEYGVKRKRLWDRAMTHLIALEIKESTWRPIVEADSPVRLARLLTELHEKA